MDWIKVYSSVLSSFATLVAIDRINERRHRLSLTHHHRQTMSVSLTLKTSMGIDFASSLEPFSRLIFFAFILPNDRMSFCDSI